MQKSLVINLIFRPLSSIHEFISLLSRLTTFKPIIMIISKKLSQYFYKRENIIFFNSYWWLNSKNIFETNSYNDMLLFQPLYDLSWMDIFSKMHA